MKYDLTIINLRLQHASFDYIIFFMVYTDLYVLYFDMSVSIMIPEKLEGNGEMVECLTLTSRTKSATLMIIHITIIVMLA